MSSKHRSRSKSPRRSNRNTTPPSAGCCRTDHYPLGEWKPGVLQYLPREFRMSVDNLDEAGEDPPYNKYYEVAMFSRKGYRHIKKFHVKSAAEEPQVHQRALEHAQKVAERVHIKQQKTQHCLLAYEWREVAPAHVEIKLPDLPGESVIIPRQKHDRFLALTRCGGSGNHPGYPVRWRFNRYGDKEPAVRPKTEMTARERGPSGIDGAQLYLPDLLFGDYATNNGHESTIFTRDRDPTHLCEQNLSHSKTYMRRYNTALIREVRQQHFEVRVWVILDPQQIDNAPVHKREAWRVSGAAATPLAYYAQSKVRRLGTPQRREEGASIEKQQYFVEQNKYAPDEVLALCKALEVSEKCVRSFDAWLVEPILPRYATLMLVERKPAEHNTYQLGARMPLVHPLLKRRAHEAEITLRNDMKHFGMRRPKPDIEKALVHGAARSTTDSTPQLYTMLRYRAEVNEVLVPRLKLSYQQNVVQSLLVLRKDLYADYSEAVDKVLSKRVKTVRSLLCQDPSLPEDEVLKQWKKDSPGSQGGCKYCHVVRPAEAMQDSTVAIAMPLSTLVSKKRGPSKKPHENEARALLCQVKAEVKRKFVPQT